MDDLYKLAPYLVALIAFVGTAYLITRGPKEGRFDCVAPVIQTAITMSTLVIYVGLLKINISPVLWIPALGAGFALGTYGSWATTLELQPDGSVKTVRTMWYLAVLAVSIGVSQILIRSSLTHQQLFNGGLAAFYFGTGTAVASNVTLIVRALRLQHTTLDEMLAPVRGFNWREGTEGSPWQQMRERLASGGPEPAIAQPSGQGQRPAPSTTAEPQAPTPPPATAMEEGLRCRNCGAPVSASMRFCRQCGRPI
jgi:zinc-ribbon domain